MKPVVHAVGAIIQNRNGGILVLLRPKDAFEGGTYGLVGGKIDKDETKESTCTREIKEEIGIDVSKSDLRFLKTFIWYRPEVKIIFEVFKLRRVFMDEKFNLQRDEVVRLDWMKPADLYKRPDLMLGLYDILGDVYKVS